MIRVSLNGAPYSVAAITLACQLVAGHLQVFGQSNLSSASHTDAPIPQAAQAKSDNSPDLVSLIRSIRNPFLTRPVPEVPMKDPESITAHVDAHGDIHLSAAEAVSLALSNNLDIAFAKLLAPIARTDIQRAAAGQLLRNVPTSTNAGPANASGPLPEAGASGYEGIANSQPGILSDLSVQLAGSQIPRLDPVFYANGSFSQVNLPEANTIVAGTNFLESQTQQWQAGFQKGFLLGTLVDANIAGTRLSQNAPNDSINPSIAANAMIRITQPLLQGFGFRVNSRAMHVAKINQTISTYTLREQLTLTITQVLTAYYDLVSFRQQLAVTLASLDRSRSLLAENKKRLDLGLLSEADYVESEATVDANEQLSADAETQIQEQEATLKLMLSRRGLEDSLLAAHIYPTDIFRLPQTDAPVESIQEVADQAVRQRLEVARSDLEIQSTELTLLGTRNAVKPTFDLYAVVQSNGLAGKINPYVAPGVLPTPPTFRGGYGRALSQVAGADYRGYEIGFQLNVPITNISARADNTRAELGLQQQKIQTQQLVNAVRLQAVKSALALQQARRQYYSSVKNRELRQQSHATQQKMFDLGTSTMGQLIGAQNELDLALRQEITAHNTYARALINLDSVLNETLDHNGIVIDETGSARSRIPEQALDVGRRDDAR